MWKRDGVQRQIQHGQKGICSQGAGVVIGWKFTSRKHWGIGDFGKTDLIGFMLKTGRGDWTSPGGVRGWGTWSDIKVDQVSRVGALVKLSL